MDKIWQAEAVLHLSGGQGGDVAATAQLSASLAAKNAAELLPLLPRIAPEEIQTTVSAGEAPDTVVIHVTLRCGRGGDDAVMMAAMTAGLTVARMKSGRLISVHPLTEEGGAVAMTGTDGDPDAVAEEHAMAYPRARPATSSVGPRARRRVAVKPAALMGEVAAPKPAKAGNPAQRDSFRAFMVDNHLHASEWARSAGVPPAAIYAYLTGSAGMISADVAEKLARAAHVAVEDLFRDK